MLALFVCGAAALQQIMAHAPAFNRSLTQVTLDGGTRLANTPWMYDEGGYLFQVGFGYLNADFVSFAGIEAQNEVATPDVARTRLETARAHLEASLRLDPANAHAWLAYAQALIALGEAEDAEAALETSFALAPHTLRISVQRVYAIKSLRQITGAPDALQKISEEDLRTLAMHAPRSAEAFSFN